MTDYDYVIVGSGAGGGTIANVLAQTGKSVLILERGGYLKREPRNWDSAAVFIDGAYVSPESWVDSKGRTFQPQVHYFVGGATKLYGACLMRPRPADFKRRLRRDGYSPEWPVDYQAMEQWYTQAEHMYHVHGQHGLDPTAGWNSRDYPHPPVSHEPRIQKLHDDLTAAGYNPFPAPSGIMLDEASPRNSPCLRCALCDGYPCPVMAKADAEAIAVRPILDMPNVHLQTNAMVTRFRTRVDDPTAVASVEYEYTGDRGRFSTERVTADRFILSAGAVNSAAILLRSNLANASDQLGRNVMLHNSRAVMALSHEPNPTEFQKTLALMDWYDQYGSVQMVGKSNASAIRGEASLLMPAWSAERIASHVIDFWLMTEDVPLPGNRVTLEADGRVRLAYKQTGREEMKALYGKLTEAMKHLGILNHRMLDRTAFMYKGMPLAAVAHQAGTARFGVNPGTSVLDPYCRVWDLDNLHVVDASFMPSVGAVNPALTIMANALRIGDHIAKGG